MTAVLGMKKLDIAAIEAAADRAEQTRTTPVPGPAVPVGCRPSGAGQHERAERAEAEA